MNAQRQIEEMAVELSEGGCADCRDCSYNNRFNCRLLYEAELLYNAGYRKQSEVIDEFAERLKESLDISVCGFSSEEVTYDVELTIDRLVEEMKGGE